MLSRICGPKRDEVRGEWKKLSDDYLNDLYASQNIIRVIKSIIMRWAGHAARMGERREMRTGFWWRDLREGEHLEDPRINARIILKYIFKKWNWVWTELIWLRIGRGGGLCECGPETLRSVKNGKLS
jgi:hypothetical protein